MRQAVNCLTDLAHFTLSSYFHSWLAKVRKPDRLVPLLCPAKLTVSSEAYCVQRSLLCPALITIQAVDEDCHRLIRRTSL